jgi:microcystin-dependent protein
MSTPFLGEIKMMSFNFAPKGWTMCNGQLLPINQNQALFAVLGTTFGGNGQTTFALPDMRGRTPIMPGNGIVLGEQIGEYAHTINISEMPSHTHTPQGASANANIAIPGPGTSLAPGHSTATGQPAVSIFGTGAPDRAFAASTITSTGGSQPHNNQQPYLVLNFCIALQGIFPSQN